LAVEASVWHQRPNVSDDRSGWFVAIDPWSLGLVEDPADGVT
jgi:hypothetical protein